MIDQNSQFFAILTAVGEAKQANATALGQPWTFSQMGVGDANGADPIPNRNQTRLINEWRRAAVNQVRTDPANPNIIITEQVIPADVGGKWIREIGLYDADGDLVAVANCAPSFKPLLVQGTGKTQIIRMNFIVANTASVVLKIDPAIVLATREYVDTQIIEAMAKMDFKHSVLVATTANIALSGVQTIDGVLLPADARVLVKNQTAGKENGLYVVSSTGVWKRAQDADSSVEVTPGLFVSVEAGTLNGDSVWQLVTDAPIVLGTTALTFEMIVGRTGVTAGTYRSVTVDKNGKVIGGTNPTSMAGYGITDAVAKPLVVTVAASKALAIDELGVVLIDASAAAVTVTLPAANAGLGVRDVLVRRIDNGGNRLVIQGGGTDKIKFHTHLRAEGYPFFVLMGAGDYWHLRSDGAGSWFPIARFDGAPVGRLVLETTTAFQPGGWGAHNGFVYKRAEWPWVWDHAQVSGMLVAEADRTGMEGGWSSGDGVTTFRAPEGRGEFLRVADEARGVDVVNFSGSITSGSPTITGMRFQGVVLTIGMALTGVGIPVGTKILGFSVAASTITMSANATATTANLTIIAGGRAPGSRQNGSLVAADMDGTGGFSPISSVSPEQPRVNRGDVGWDTPVPVDYPTGVSATVGGSQALNFVLSTRPEWFGVSRPRNIAYPGRLKLI